MTNIQGENEPDLLKRVTVRLLSWEECERFDLLIEQKHYLADVIKSG